MAKEYENTTLITCPYCGHEHQGSSEYQTEAFPMECEKCGESFWCEGIAAWNTWV